MTQGSGAGRDPAPVTSTALGLELLEDYVPSPTSFFHTPHDGEPNYSDSLTALNLEKPVEYDPVAQSQDSHRQHSRQRVGPVFHQQTRVCSLNWGI